ncbi:hypothetical protein PACTADRAFT_51756 [Pachysolen tannophilus NRRL Y-2460]|uniref:GST N-terminal domain-containing protein n=1 Tax=Pachysolen tannophilus NRRL Y-2460 TaxID=669874 RepID=A0A1E4TQM4_PACTA|nr:hypothetical protein PACTADRAFT_51756 [Pachysolen tannophilus NRRL Y-2460]
MAKPEKYILYDLSSELKPKTWSPNTCKVRLTLNYLGIPFESKFLKYPEIKEVLSSLGVEPWESQTIFHKAEYTLPALTIRYENGSEETVMGTEENILNKIVSVYGKDKLYQGEEEFCEVLMGYYGEYLKGLVFKNVVPFIRNILDDDGGFTKKFFDNTRTISPAQLDMLRERDSRQMETEWQEFKDELASFKSLKKVCEGQTSDEKFEYYIGKLDKFLKGDSKYLISDENPSFADFVLFSIILWCKQSVKGGALEFDFLTRVEKVWYERISKYNY